MHTSILKTRRHIDIHIHVDYFRARVFSIFNPIHENHDHQFIIWGSHSMLKLVLDIEYMCYVMWEFMYG